MKEDGCNPFPAFEGTLSSGSQVWQGLGDRRNRLGNHWVQLVDPCLRWQKGVIVVVSKTAELVEGCN